MGQKVSPIGFRMGVNKTWESKWFASNKNFAEYLQKDEKIRKYLSKRLKEASVSSVLINRNQKKTEVIINTAKPGVVIGHGGDEIEKLKKELNKLVNEEIQISIMEVKNPDLDAALVAQSIATAIENRVSFRVAQKKAIQRVRKAGAKGVRTMISGRLGGADIARSEGYKEGIVPLTTLRSDIDYAHAEAVTAYGRLGVKVWICRGEVLDTKEEKDNAKKGE